MSLPTRPTADAEFASGISAAVVEPGSSKKLLGWIAEKPPHQYFNWLARITWQWQIYFDRRTMYTEYVTTNFAPTIDRSRRVHMDPTTANLNFTLPAITNADNDLAFEIKKVGATGNIITIVGTVEGQVNPTIENQYTGVGIYAYNSAWFWSK